MAKVLFFCILRGARGLGSTWGNRYLVDMLLDLLWPECRLGSLGVHLHDLLDILDLLDELHVCHPPDVLGLPGRINLITHNRKRKRSSMRNKNGKGNNKVGARESLVPPRLSPSPLVFHFGWIKKINLATASVVYLPTCLLVYLCTCLLV